MLFIRSKTGDAWPLVGREKQLKRIESIHAAPAGQPGSGGVVLVGEPGAGKTRLAREALARMSASDVDGGTPAAWVGATRSAAAVPLGALGSLLTRHRVRGNGDPLGALVARLASDSAYRTVLAVDDAHLLDDASAAVLHQLAAGRHAFVLATVTAGKPAPDAVTSLWTDEVATRIEVPPLAGSEVSALVEVALGGRMDAVSAQEARRLCAGNPQLLRELLLAGRETGALRRTGGWWRWDAARGYATTRLSDVVHARLGTLDPELLALAELLACADRLPLALVKEVAGERTVVEAERRGLVRAELAQSRTLVGLAHPIYAAVIRAGTPRSREREIWRILAAAIEATPMRRGDDLLLATRWRLRAGGAGQPDQLLAAARQAADRLALPEATQLARQAKLAGAGEPAGLLLAELLAEQGRYDEAAQALPDRPPESLAARWRATRQRIDYFGHGGRLPQIDPDPWLLLAAGRVRDAAETHSVPALAAAGLLGRHRSDALASALVAAYREAERRPWGPTQVAAAGCLALLATGHLRDARALADRSYADAVQLVERIGDAAAAIVGVNAAARGMVALAQGQTGAALAGLTEAAVLLDGWPTFRLQRLLLAQLAAAHAVRGEVAAARRRLEQADRHGDSPVRLADVWVERARAWVTAATGDLTRAAGYAIDASGLARDTEQPTIQALALYDAARFGQARRAHSHLATLADQLRLPVVSALAGAASALRSATEASPLDSAAAELAENGHLLYAAEAAQAAHVRHAYLGRRHAANRSLVRADALARECDGARTPMLAAAEPGPVLTSRERQVATLAAAGHSGPTIASQLGLSVRTVNNYLGRTYFKLGINNRSQLAGVLGLEPVRGEARRATVR